MRYLFIACLLSVGCSHSFKSSTTVCPEYRSLACTSAPECSMDRDRGCQVCQCAPPGVVDKTGGLPNGLPPDRR
jgi:hypothetical protein